MSNGTFETKVRVGGPLWTVPGKCTIKVIYGHEKNTNEVSFQYLK